MPGHDDHFAGTCCALASMGDFGGDELLEEAARFVVVGGEEHCSISLPSEFGIPVMAGHSRSKDGVASARLCPAIHVFLVT